MQDSKSNNILVRPNLVKYLLIFLVLILFVIYHILFFLKDTDDRAERLLYEAYRLRKNKLEDKALIKLKEAFNHCKKWCTPDIYHKIVIHLTETYYNTGDIKTALGIYLDYIERDEWEKDEDKRDALINLGYTYLGLNDQKNALKSFQRAITASDKPAHPKLLIRYNFEAANSFYEKKDREKQILHYNKTIELIKLNNLQELFLDILINSHIELGNIYQRESNREKTDFNYLESLKYFEAILENKKNLYDKNNLCHLHNEMAKINYYFLDRAELIKNIETAGILCKEIGNSFELASSSLILGDFYKTARNLSESEANYQKAAKLFGEIHREDMVAHSFFSLGLLYRSLNLTTQANSSFKKAKEITEKSGAPSLYILDEIKKLTEQ